MLILLGGLISPKQVNVALQPLISVLDRVLRFIRYTLTDSYIYLLIEVF